MRTEVLETSTPQLFQAAVERIAAALAAGEVVALPTETVYGLAANAWNAKAVARIFELKGRPEHNPVIVHIVGVSMAQECVQHWTAQADVLARSFWPGPLTLVLQKSQVVPSVVTAGGGTVGLRWPRHPFMQAVIQRCGFPLAAPSANRSNELSPTQARHVLKGLDQRISLIVDGGSSQFGIESTVVDLVARPPRVLRPGVVQRETIEAVLGEEVLAGVEEDHHATRRSPGQLPRHYAPRAKLVVWQWHDEADLIDRVLSLGVSLSRTQVIAHTQIPSGEGFGRVSVIPHDPEAFARALYAELHRCDEEGAALIVMEAVPEQPEWEGVADRLRRATTA
jgi:L-threonylcarbamoyladenylate synthase